MAHGTAMPSFDDVIQANRERQRHSNLAQNILGSRSQNRVASSGARFNGREAGSGLAGRVGVTKRSASLNSKPKYGHDPSKPAFNSRADPFGMRPTRPVRQMSTKDDRFREDLLSQALVAKGATNQARKARRNGPEISIRGAAGPYVVLASNFAPGTTAADIESAMVSGDQELLSCEIVSTIPTVDAELVFAERTVAEQVIDMFNDKKADGRILSLRLSIGGPSTAATSLSGTRINGSAKATTIADSHDADREEADRNRRYAAASAWTHPDRESRLDRSGMARNSIPDDSMDVDVEMPILPTGPRNPTDRFAPRRDGYYDRRETYRSYDRYDSRNTPRGRGQPRDWDQTQARIDRFPHGNGSYSGYQRYGP